MKRSPLNTLIAGMAGLAHAAMDRHADVPDDR